MHRRLGHAAVESTSRRRPRRRDRRAASRAGKRARAEAATFYLEAASAAQASYQLVLAARYYRRAVKLAPRLDPSRLAAFEALETIARIQGKWRERRRSSRRAPSHRRATKRTAVLGRGRA